MANRRIEDLLSEMGQRGVERPRPGLARAIKDRIPYRLVPHRMDTISIIVDLRVSRIAAAAVIVLALLLAGVFLGRRDAAGRRLYDDGRLFLQYALSGQEVCNAQVVSNLAHLRDDLIAQGREVVFYGDAVDLSNRYAVVMYWKLDDDKYGVVLGDLSARTVSSSTLIRLQTHMLKDGQK